MTNTELGDALKSHRYHAHRAIRSPSQVNFYRERAAWNRIVHFMESAESQQILKQERNWIFLTASEAS